MIAGQVSLFHHSILSPSSLQRFSSSASQPDEKETVQSGNGAAKTTGDAEVSDQTKSSASGNTSDQTEELGSIQFFILTCSCVLQNLKRNE